jgi:hypothetical protein
MLVMEEGHVNTQSADLSTILIDLHLEELRAQAARDRLGAQAMRQRRRVGARQPRRTVGGLLIAALSIPALETTRSLRHALPHRDGG